MNGNAILEIAKLGFPWQTQDPFLFCVYHLDFYPKGNEQLGPPPALLKGRNIGNDFVIKDGFRMYHGDVVPGFPVHPHRGFETVTFVLQGLVDHSDSKGAAGRYGNGDVQWMTAGKGLQHAEMFPLLKKDTNNTSELFQIWLNLPASKKMVDPAYKMLWEEEIPHVKTEDKNQRKVNLDLVAGNYENHIPPTPAPDSWAANSENEVIIWQITMEENAQFPLPPAKGKVNRTLYFFEGETIQIENNTINPTNVLVLDGKISCSIQNGNKKSRLLLLQGKPIEEPVEQYGPFVMNNLAEIRQAFEDFRETQFGGWPWPRRDMVHGTEYKRFARFSDGSEMIK